MLLSTAAVKHLPDEQLAYFNKTHTDWMTEEKYPGSDMFSLVVTHNLVFGEPGRYAVQLDRRFFYRRCEIERPKKGRWRCSWLPDAHWSVRMKVPVRHGESLREMLDFVDEFLDSNPLQWVDLPYEKEADPGLFRLPSGWSCCPFSGLSGGPLVGDSFQPVYELAFG
jgi:hypothetical protein